MSIAATPPASATSRRPVELPPYDRDGASIYRSSFATIRAEADLDRFGADLSQVIVRMIHACGQTDLPRDIRASDDVVAAARNAITAGCPIFCDAHMVAEGITASRFSQPNPVICTLRDPATRELADAEKTTRSAAAVDLWLPQLAGSVVAIGNAPTALFRLLEHLQRGAPAPAAIVGVPVGFIGAAESKTALAESASQWGIPYITVLGRRGGSAMASAALNALATPKEII